MLGFEKEYFTGVLTSFIGPQAGWSTSVTIFRAIATSCQPLCSNFGVYSDVLCS